MQPFYREAGSGPAVICLHCNASSSGQWRGLMDRLAPTHHVIAPDLIGAGPTRADKSPPLPDGRAATLDDEVERLAPLLERFETFSLVGHSYGGAVALKAALRWPQRVTRLVLYEPTLFAVLRDQPEGLAAAEGINAVCAQSAERARAGDLAGAAACFIDYWETPGTFAAMPQARQDAVAGSMTHIAAWIAALTTDDTPLSTLATLDRPVLLLTGGTSPVSSLSVAAVLARTLPNVTTRTFAGAGHMGPVSHAGPVNAAMADFLSVR